MKNILAYLYEHIKIFHQKTYFEYNKHKKCKLLEDNGLDKNNMFLFQENQNSLNHQTDSQSAKLAVIAGAITTLGDVLATMASVLAIEETRQEQDDNKNIQKQLDYLTFEMEKIKKHLNLPRR